MNRRQFITKSARGIAGIWLASQVPWLVAEESSREPESSWWDPTWEDPLKSWRQSLPPVNVDEDDPNVFVFSRLRYITDTRVKDVWDVHPAGDENMLAYLRIATNIKVSNKSWYKRSVGIDEGERLYNSPFLFMTGEGEFTLTSEQAAELGEFFKRGGFMYADDCVVGTTGDQFYKSFLREIKKVMPGYEMHPVPHNHAIYHCFYDFPNGAPFFQGTPHPDMGLFYKDRLVAFLTSGDLHCAWVGWFSPEGREQCFKMGVNIITYALTH